MALASPLVPFLVTGTVVYVVVKLLMAAMSTHPKSQALRPPDGPPGLPLIGNLHQLPKTGAHRLFTEWAKTYGGIFSLKMGPALAVVITDRQIVKDLLDKKSAIYSDRPPSYVSHDLITKGDHLLVMKYGETWRSFRRAIHQFFRETACESEQIKSLVDAEQVQMMRDFLVKPENHMRHTKRTSNSIIMSLVFGIRTDSDQTPHMKELYAVMERWSEVMEVGATPPVDIFPFLKYAPESLFNNWVQRSLDVGNRMKSLYSSMKAQVIARRASGSQKVPTFMDQVLDSNNIKSQTPLTENQRDFIGGVLMEGGSDTVSTMMLVVIQALTLHPEVQRRAQAEIDAVCTDKASPAWSDYNRLPYIAQIVKEAMRWRPVTPLAFPHALSQDDTITTPDGRQFFLPKGTTVFLNVWGLHHDPERFQNPDEFNPDRFANQTRPAAEYTASGVDRDHFIYGAGRRICPGIHLAEREMFLGTAKLLWGFNFEQVVDEKTGLKLPIDTDPTTGYTEGFLVCPADFPCKVTVRSGERAKTILREFEKADVEVFSKYRG
ncbi:cytochrome P450 [Rhypophila decipiens]|uniref:Cytochrome P450 n=1 Tax=Rhypophila decipiens TaxID=261697 RepID=A0AAN7B8P7_9PEZI|nr:cytochrome P450 [Rhypophila decipiens]